MALKANVIAGVVLLLFSLIGLFLVGNTIPVISDGVRSVQTIECNPDALQQTLRQVSKGETEADETKTDSPRTDSPMTPLMTASSPAVGPKRLLQVLPCAPLGDSQGNQDCIIDKVFEAIGTSNKYYVEYGFNTNQQCSFSGPNSCRLWKNGWKGLLLDGSHQNETINLHSHYLYANNMVAILKKYGVPKELDFYSGDMDSHDYFVLKSVLDSGLYRPRFLATEFNSNWPSTWAVSQIDPTIAYPDQEPPPYKFQNCVWGASAEAYRYLMEKHGYSLVAVTHVLDLFWIRNDILEEKGLAVPPYEEVVRGFLGHPLHEPRGDTLWLSKMVDVRVYEETKSYRQANRAMVETILAHIKDPTVRTIGCLANMRPAHLEAYLAEQPIIGRHLNLD